MLRANLWLLEVTNQIHVMFSKFLYQGQCADDRDPRPYHEIRDGGFSYTGNGDHFICFAGKIVHELAHAASMCKWAVGFGYVQSCAHEQNLFLF